MLDFHRSRFDWRIPVRIGIFHRKTSKNKFLHRMDDVDISEIRRIARFFLDPLSTIFVIKLFVRRKK